MLAAKELENIDNIRKQLCKINKKINCSNVNKIYAGWSIQHQKRRG